MRLREGDFVRMDDGKVGRIAKLRAKRATGGPTIAVEVLDHYWIYRSDVKEKATADEFWNGSDLQPKAS